MEKPVIWTLRDFERNQYAVHLKRLPDRDRYLRFSYMISNQGIDDYVSNQVIEKSTIICAQYSDRVIAAIVVEYDLGKFHATNNIAEIALSVEPQYRNSGLGTQLFNQALQQAQGCGTKMLISYCLSQNRFMNKIANRYHMTVKSALGESVGKLIL